MELCNPLSEFPMEEDTEPMDVTQFLFQSQGTEPVDSDTDNSDAEDVKDTKVGITNGCLSKSSSSSSGGGVVGSSLSVLGSTETAPRSLSSSPKIKMEVKVEQPADTMIDEDETDPPPPVQQTPIITGDDDEDDDDSSSSSDSSDDSSSSSSSSSSSNSNTESKV